MLVCVVWPIVSPRLSGKAVYFCVCVCPWWGENHRKFLLCFFTSWNTSILLPPGVSNMSLWEGRLVHSLAPPVGQWPPVGFYTECWEERRNCITAVAGGKKPISVWDANMKMISGELSAMEVLSISCLKKSPRQQLLELLLLNHFMANILQFT